MHDACIALWPNMDAGIMTAAVADYRPETAADKKIKKDGDSLSLNLVKNPDIAATLGKVKKANQRLIGFALETNDGKKYALGKLQRKNFDAIVLNLHTPEATAFGGDTNQVTILKADGEEIPFDRMPKIMVSHEIVNVLVELWV